MPDYAGFQHGGTTFPVTESLTNSFLRDADPAVFYALEYYKAVIETHIGDRLLAEASAVGAVQVAKAVEQTLPLNPEPFLLEQHIKFPLLALYRRNGTWRMVGQRRAINETVELAYVLPPMQAGEAERLMPVLKAVTAIIDNRTEQGFDPTYTPTDGSAGDVVWSANFAGMMTVEVQRVEYGDYQPTETLFFPAVVIQVQMTERADTAATDFVTFDGGDVTVELQSDEPAPDLTMLQASTRAAPAITNVAPTTVAYTGGTTVTITGTDFYNPAQVFIGGKAATNVVATSSTTITCTSPAFSIVGVGVTVDVEVRTEYGTALSEDAITLAVQNPTDLGLTGLHAAWDSRFGITLDGSVVTDWTELVQTEAMESTYTGEVSYSHHPTYETDVANGQPAVKFTPNDTSVKAQWLRLTGGMRVMNSGFTVLAVIKYGDTRTITNHIQNVPRTILSESSVNTFSGGGLRGGEVAYQYFDGGWQTPYPTAGGPYNDDLVRVIGWSHTPTGLGELKFYHGASQVGSTVTAGYLTGGQFGYSAIGTGYRAEGNPDGYGGDDGYLGYLLALAVFTGEASAGDRTTFHGWAQNDFGAV